MYIAKFLAIAIIFARVAVADEPPAKWESALKKHNYYRCLHGVSDLEWDNTIAKKAQDWTDQMQGQMKHSDFSYRQNVAGFGFLGENAAQGASPDAAVQMWYDEIKLTPGGKGKETTFKMTTAHYTQVVWKGSSKLGCGETKGMTICMYGEGGNMQGAYDDNVLLYDSSKEAECGKSGGAEKESDGTEKESKEAANGASEATSDTDGAVSSFISVQAEGKGITEDNKDAICKSIATALDGESTKCKIESCSGRNLFIGDVGGAIAGAANAVADGAKESFDKAKNKVGDLFGKDGDADAGKAGEEGGKADANGNPEGGKADAKSDSEGGKADTNGDSEGDKADTNGDSEGDKADTNGDSEGDKADAKSDSEGDKADSKGDQEGGKADANGDKEGGKADAKGDEEADTKATESTCVISKVSVSDAAAAKEKVSSANFVDSLKNLPEVTLTDISVTKGDSGKEDGKSDSGKEDSKSVSGKKDGKSDSGKEDGKATAEKKTGKAIAEKKTAKATAEKKTGKSDSGKEDGKSDNGKQEQKQGKTTSNKNSDSSAKSNDGPNKDKRDVGGSDTTTESDGEGGEGDSGWESALKKHNYYRCLHGVPELQWDATIAKKAQEWTDNMQGQMKHSDMSFRQNVGGFGFLGENLAQGASKVASVQMWYDEIKDTPGGKGLETDFKMNTAHYTQVVWKGTTKLGCGETKGMICCMYGEGGNMQGAYAENVLPVDSSKECKNVEGAENNSEKGSKGSSEKGTKESSEKGTKDNSEKEPKDRPKDSSEKGPKGNSDTGSSGKSDANSNDGKQEQNQGESSRNKGDISDKSSGGSDANESDVGGSDAAAESDGEDGGESGAWKAALKRHNYYRCLHGVPNLKWDPTIAKKAQEWTDRMQGQMKHSDMSFRQNVGGFGFLGENLAQGASKEASVKMWYDEIKDTPGGKGEETDFKMNTAHYTQVVWKKTTNLGCGETKGMICCMYGEGGNMQGAYAENVLPVDSSKESDCKNAKDSSGEGEGKSSDEKTGAKTTATTAKEGETSSSINGKNNNDARDSSGEGEDKSGDEKTEGKSSEEKSEGKSSDEKTEDKEGKTTSTNGENKNDDAVLEDGHGSTDGHGSGDGHGGMDRGSSNSNAKGDVEDGDKSGLDKTGESSDSSTKSSDEKTTDDAGSEDGHGATDGHGSGDNNGKGDVKEGDKSGLDKTGESSNSSTKSSDGKTTDDAGSEDGHSSTDGQGSGDGHSGMDLGSGDNNGKGGVNNGDKSGLDKTGESSDSSTKSSDEKTTNGPASGDGPVSGDTEGEGDIKDGDKSGSDKSGESSEGKTTKKEKLRTTIQKLTDEYLDLVDKEPCSPEEPKTETLNEYEEDLLLHLAI